MRIKSYSILESIFILSVISLLSSVFIFNKPILLRKNEVISSIINSQYKSFLNHTRIDFDHSLVNDYIWFNMNGSVNKANTIRINGSNQFFTIMLFTGRIHE